MKKLISVTLAIILCLSLTACGSRTASTAGNGASEESKATESASSSSGEKSTNGVSPSSKKDTNPDTSKKALVVYFSYSGNTQKVANWIAQETGADVFRIKPVKPYPADYDQCVDQAEKERDENARPEILGTVDNIDDYDTIFLGYPCWWYTCPMITLSFLEKYDLSGKTIIPFTTHGGSGFSGSLNAIKEICPNTTYLDGIAIRDTEVNDSQSDVIRWLNGLGFNKP